MIKYQLNEDRRTNLTHQLLFLLFGVCMAVVKVGWGPYIFFIQHTVCGSWHFQNILAMYLCVVKHRLDIITAYSNNFAEFGRVESKISSQMLLVTIISTPRVYEPFKKFQTAARTRFKILSKGSRSSWIHPCCYDSTKIPTTFLLINSKEFLLLI